MLQPKSGCMCETQKLVATQKWHPILPSIINHRLKYTPGIDSLARFGGFPIVLGDVLFPFLVFLDLVVNINLVNDLNCPGLEHHIQFSC